MSPPCTGTNNVKEALMTMLFLFAQEHTGYFTLLSMPTVVKMPHQKMEEIACASKPCTVSGLYMGENDIYLDDSLDLENSLLAQGIVLHEMIHYLQHKVGQMPIPNHDCAGIIRSERQAYRIQNSFLDGRGKRGLLIPIMSCN